MGMMNNHSNGIQHPRHPSRDNLQRRAQHQQQLPDDSPGGSRRRPSNGHVRVRFPDDDEEEGEGILSKVAGVFFGFVASICLLGLLTILGILYVTVRPFSVAAYRRVANQLAAAAFLDAIALLLPNMKIYLTGDSDVPSPVGTSILVSNHLMDGDWWAILMLGRCVGLRGSVKAILRNEILHLNVRDDSYMIDRQITPALIKQAVVAATSANGGGTAPMAIRNGSSHGLATPPYREINSSNSSSPTSSQSSHASAASHVHRHRTSRDLTILAKLLHAFMEFPLLNGEDYISDREHLFQLLRSFAENNGAEAPVHLLFFPEGWSLHNGTDRGSVLAMSNDFAKREGRPQLKHLLLPKTTGFNASLECLRESSPVVYDVTMAYTGYDGSLPPKFDLSFISLWNMMRHKFPTEVHVRIRRYSMEEVLQDATWLDKKWAEKDRLLNFFSTHQSFPTDGRGFCRHRLFNTRTHSIEGSAMALTRLLLMPYAIPFLLFLSIPLFWTVLWIYLIHRGYHALFPERDGEGTSASNDEGGGTGMAEQTPRSESAAGTPYFPATPFVSPSMSNWRDMITGANRDQNNNQ